MKNYRIIVRESYTDCFPRMEYYVQVRNKNSMFHEWVDIKGYEDKNKAVELYHFLKNG